jgi:3-deoxy-manno-octulosonate cytidylyltransferase (CMP-KDO synthetase)
MKKKTVLGLIPTRLNSTRLPQKALLSINNIPLVVHTYKRAKLSKKLDDLYICCDDKKIFNVVKKFGVKVLMTSKHQQNGTERICEAYQKLGKKYDLVVDIQGDEPLISPYHINDVINHHLKNPNFDIILPILKAKNKNNTNIIKVVTDKKNKVLYLSRANIPFEFKRSNTYMDKHLSIISFKPNALVAFSKHKKTRLESIEDIELLRALEIGLTIKTIKLDGDSFSVDIFEDYAKANKKMSKDKFFKLYK